MKALIQIGSDRILEIVDTESPVSDSFEWIDALSWVTTQDTWDGTKFVLFVPPVPTPPEDTELTPEDTERLFLSLGVTLGAIQQAKRDRGKPF